MADSQYLNQRSLLGSTENKTLKGVTRLNYKNRCKKVMKTHIEPSTSNNYIENTCSLSGSSFIHSLTSNESGAREERLQENMEKLSKFQKKLQSGIDKLMRLKATTTRLQSKMNASQAEIKLNNDELIKTKTGVAKFTNKLKLRTKELKCLKKRNDSMIDSLKENKELLKDKRKIFHASISYNEQKNDTTETQSKIFI